MTQIEHGSTSVYADLGTGDADGVLVKAQLATKIGEIIKQRKLTQMQAAELLGIPQPKCLSRTRSIALRRIWARTCCATSSSSACHFESYDLECD